MCSDEDLKPESAAETNDEEGQRKAIRQKQKFDRSKIPSSKLRLYHIRSSWFYQMDLP